MILTTTGIHLENISHCLHVFSEVAAHFPTVEAVAVYTSVGAAALMDGGGGRKVSTQPVWPCKLKGRNLLISTDRESVCCGALPQQFLFVPHIAVFAVAASSDDPTSYQQHFLLSPQVDFVHLINTL